MIPNSPSIILSPTATPSCKALVAGTPGSPSCKALGAGPGVLACKALEVRFGSGTATEELKVDEVVHSPGSVSLATTSGGSSTDVESIDNQEGQAESTLMLEGNRASTMDAEEYEIAAGTICNATSPQVTVQDKDNNTINVQGNECDILYGKSGNILEVKDVGSDFYLAPAAADSVRKACVVTRRTHVLLRKLQRSFVIPPAAVVLPEFIVESFRMVLDPKRLPTTNEVMKLQISLGELVHLLEKESQHTGSSGFRESVFQQVCRVKECGIANSEVAEIGSALNCTPPDGDSSEEHGRQSFFPT